ncbi:MAG: polyphenol oxidase family protein [Candidatus Adiutrix sp.]|jgi:YfiH family protein|nr:polyphenol oxidase family protein [Candidatus Adiutrix sp.]
MLKKNTRNGLIWYEFSIFDSCPELRHGVFTRHGGVSGSHGRDLSLAFNDFDPPDNVRQNLARAEKALGLTPAAFVRQTHSANISVVRPQDAYQPRNPSEVRQDCDALIAPEPGVSLLIKVADCQGVILYDPATRALALVHSGWRGSVQNIIGLAVDQLIGFGVRPADILAAVSPSLGPCCAEFVNYRRELPEDFQAFMVREGYFDFWAVSRRQLTERGLLPENIEVAGICTKCAPDFFSYRRGDRWERFGLMAAVEGAGDRPGLALA